MENCDRDRIVSLITFSGPCSQLSCLNGVLNQLGYSTQTSSVPTDGFPDINGLNGQILFLSHTDQLPELLAQLRKWPALPRLAIFDEGVPWDREIIDFCTEVTTWPCSKTELFFRLERAFSAVDSRGEDVSTEVCMRLNMIGEAPAFLHTLSVIRRIAKYKTTVLIRGETGTGKELAAHAIHYLGNAKDGPFVPINCGGIPDELFENELFGHAPGAYTDAKVRQCGYVEQASGGTLFLDEIDALSLKSQATLLRLLQDKAYKPLGSERPRQADIRIIVATNANLRAKVEAQEFRQDLLFRLDVLSIQLPPLRERPGDASLLAQHFVKRFSREYDKTLRPLHPAFLCWIEDYPWPGNIRELENTVLRAFLLSDGPFVSDRDEGEGELSETRIPSTFSAQKAQAIAIFERQYLDRLLIEAHGNISLAAKLAGKERRALGKLLQKHAINRADYLSSRL